MKKTTIIFATIILVSVMTLSGCGDNLFADIDNSDNSDNSTTMSTTASSTDSNTSSSVDSNNTLEVPTFPANSMGKIVVQCEEDIAYFIMAYNCLMTDTRVDAIVDNSTVAIDNRSAMPGTNGTIYYIEGHVERTEAITITGTVFSGGVDLSINPEWVAKCD